jgi:hypothetical protein
MNDTSGFSVKTIRIPSSVKKLHQTSIALLTVEFLSCILAVEEVSGDYRCAAAKV